MYYVRKVIIEPTDTLMNSLKEERKNRKIENISETITAVLSQYFRINNDPVVKIYINSKITKALKS